MEAALRQWSDIDSGRVLNGHASAMLLSQLISDWRTYFSFAFVRNPWDFWVSLYHHILTVGPVHPEWARVSCTRDFRGYMGDYILRRFERRYILNQIDYVVGNDGKLLVNFVGRYEHLLPCFEFSCRQIGIPRCDLPRINTSRRRADYRTYYDETTKKIVSKVSRNDISAFGYEF